MPIDLQLPQVPDVAHPEPAREEYQRIYFAIRLLEAKIEELEARIVVLEP